MADFIANAIVFIACALIIVACLFAYTWHRLGSLKAARDYFLSVEATKDSSPMCHGGGANDRLTSNIGVRQQIIRRGPIGLNAQYTHHSCAINRDREGYDAVGV